MLWILFVGVAAVLYAIRFVVDRFQVWRMRRRGEDVPSYEERMRRGRRAPVVFLGNNIIPASENETLELPPGMTEEELRTRVLEAMFPAQKVIDAPSDKLKNDDDTTRTDPMEDAETPDTAHREACPVCLEPFEHGQAYLSGGDCIHRYHWTCVLSWLQKSEDCPVCRRAMWDPQAFKDVQNEVLRSARAEMEAAAEAEKKVKPKDDDVAV